MCGRFTLAPTLEDLQARFDFEAGELVYRPRYNIAPAQDVLAVVNDGGSRRAGFLRWRLVHSWAKEPSIGNRMINARAETVADRPAFRTALRRRRCLVLADGFFEWKNENGRKLPMYISLKSREPFGMAGLWEAWKDPEGGILRTCVIVTTAANSAMEPIHNRMPVILTRETESAWLDHVMVEPGALSSFLAPYPGDDLEAFPVSTLVNSTRNDSPECIFPADR